MTRSGRITLLASITVAVGMATASVVLARSDAPSGNVAATRAYLRDSERLYVALREALPQGRSAASSYVAGVVGECAGALSPPGGAALKGKAQVVQGDIAREAYGATAIALTLGALVADGGRAKALQQLRQAVRWRDPEADLLGRSLAGAERQVLSPGPPRLCDDLREWAAGGYAVEPAGTKRFLARWEVAEPKVTTAMHERFPALTMGEPLDEALIGRLRRYESRGARRLHGEVARLRDRVGRAYVEAAAVSEASMSHALGLHLPSLLVSDGAGHTGHAPTGAGIPPPAAVRRAGGRKLKEFYAGRRVLVGAGCEACHLVDHAGNRGPGPPLTHVGSKLSEEQIRDALLHPKAPMPSFKGMTKKHRNALVKFLAMLR